MQRPRLSLPVYLAFLLAPLPVVAATPPATVNLPQEIQRGLSSFKTSGGRVAVESWTRGGPLQDTGVETSQVSAIEKLEDLYGRYQGHSPIAQIRLTPASRLIYLEIQLEKGPVYYKFHVFTGKLGTHLVSIEVDPVPERLLPPYVLEKMTGLHRTGP